MKMTMLALFATAVLFSGVSVAQQLDGRNCNWAYKKLQQHRTNGSCFERGGQGGLNGEKHVSQAKDRNTIDRVRDVVREHFPN